ATSPLAIDNTGGFCFPLSVPCSIPHSTTRERRHRGLARRSVAVGRAAIFLHSPRQSNPTPIRIEMLGGGKSSRVPQRIKGRPHSPLVLFDCSVLLDDHLRQLKNSTIKRRRRIYVPVRMGYEECTANSLETEHHGYR